MHYYTKFYLLIEKNLMIFMPTEMSQEIKSHCYSLIPLTYPVFLHQQTEASSPSPFISHVEACKCQSLDRPLEPEFVKKTPLCSSEISVCSSYTVVV